MPQSYARLPEMMVLMIALDPAAAPATTAAVVASPSIASVVDPARSYRVMNVCIYWSGRPESNS